MNPSVVIVGGGPAGAAAGRLLASWGHRVLVIDRADGRAGTRGLAESLPPTTRKLLAEIGVLTAVEHAAFYRSTGNTVWWGARERRVERFGDAAYGFQVHRPDLDRVLLNEAASAGVEVTRARVRTVDVEHDNEARVTYDENGRTHTISCRFVLDCSGRAGVVARRFRRAGQRMYALVGEWRSEGGWDLPDPTHTVVEAYDRGWAWSVPTSPAVRHAGLMIDGRSPRAADGRALVDAYRAELAKTSAMERLLRGATLVHAWACDASTYSSHSYAGPRFLLVGDAASFIDPLSSFGVKKALASAWVAAVTVNTCLVHPSRESWALDFYAAWERDVWTSHVAQTRDFAREAAVRHPHPFWIARASQPMADAPVMQPARPRLDVTAALRRIRESAELDLALDERVTFEPRPVIRGREIVLEDALTLPHRTQSRRAPSLGTGHDAMAASARFVDDRVRFVDNVDLVALARLASHHRQVPDLFEAYCRTIGPAPLPNVLSGLSLLVATGVLRHRSSMPC